MNEDNAAGTNGQQCARQKNLHELAVQWFMFFSAGEYSGALSKRTYSLINSPPCVMSKKKTL